MPTACLCMRGAAVCMFCCPATTQYVPCGQVRRCWSLSGPCWPSAGIMLARVWKMFTLASVLAHRWGCAGHAGAMLALSQSQAGHQPRPCRGQPWVLGALLFVCWDHTPPLVMSTLLRSRAIFAAVRRFTGRSQAGEAEVRLACLWRMSVSATSASLSVVRVRPV